jgi:hypothetical protein
LFNEVNRALLTREQRETLEAFESGFQSTFWELILERFQRHADSNQQQYDSVLGEQALGLIQGLQRANREILNLEQIIEREITAAVSPEEALEPEGPEFDDQWTMD